MATFHRSDDYLTEDVVEESEETMKEWKAELTADIEQMMFVSGETAEVSFTTTGIIEEIVREQVVEMVSTHPPFSDYNLLRHYFS